MSVLARESTKAGPHLPDSDDVLQVQVREDVVENDVVVENAAHRPFLCRIRDGEGSTVSICQFKEPAGALAHGGEC